MSHSFRLTAAEVDSHPIPMMERAPLKTPAATFGSFPAAPGYHSVIEQVLFSFFLMLIIILLFFFCFAHHLLTSLVCLIVVDFVNWQGF